MSAVDIAKQIKAGKGTATLMTVSGGKPWAMLDGKAIVLEH